MTGAWRQLSPPPLELHHFQPVVYEGRVWVVGAMTGPYPNESNVATVRIWDPRTDAWTLGPPFPSGRARGGAGTVVYDDRIYVVGGKQPGPQRRRARVVRRAGPRHRDVDAAARRAARTRPLHGRGRRQPARRSGRPAHDAAQSVREHGARGRRVRSDRQRLAHAPERPADRARRHDDRRRRPARRRRRRRERRHERGARRGRGARRPHGRLALTPASRRRPSLGRPRGRRRPGLRRVGLRTGRRLP